MTWLLTLLLTSADADIVRRNPVTAEFTTMFISACLDGQARLDPDRIREVDARDVSAFWETERRQKNARYYRISKPAAAALIVTDYAPANAEGFKRTCELVTRGHDIRTAWHLISKAMAGKPARHVHDADIYTIDHPAAGYRIAVRSWFLSVGEYKAEIVREARSRPGGPKKMVVMAEDSIFE